MNDFQRNALQAAIIGMGLSDFCCEPLSRYKDTVWFVRDASDRKAVVKLASGVTEYLTTESAWLDHEYRVTRWAYEQGLIARTPLGLGSHLPKATFTTWISFEYLAGRTARQACSSSLQSAEIAESTLRILRRLHESESDEFLVPTATQARGTLERALLQIGYPSLEQHISRLLSADTCLMPCHGDVSFNNILITSSNQQVELIDWGLSRYGNPCLDLAPIFVWLSLWGDMQVALEFLNSLTKIYAWLGLSFLDAFHVFLARSALVRATWKGPIWATIAQRLVAIRDPYRATKELFTMVGELGLEREVGFAQ